MYTTSVTKSGQVTLTKAAREALGIKPGDRVTISLRDHKATLERELSDAKIFDRLDALKSPRTKDLIKKNRGKTVRELRSEWDKSPAGVKYYEEKYHV